MSVDDVPALETQKGVLMSIRMLCDVQAAANKRRTRLVRTIQRTNKPCWTYTDGTWWRYSTRKGNLVCDGRRLKDGNYTLLHPWSA